MEEVLVEKPSSSASSRALEDDRPSRTPTPGIPEGAAPNVLLKSDFAKYLRELRWSPSLRSHTYVLFSAPGCRYDDISALKELKHLQEIDLSENNFGEFSALNGLPDLLKLNVRANRISKFNVPNSPIIQELNLSKNYIKSFPPSWTESLGSSLESLDISGNYLASLAGFPKFFNLDVLCLRKNNLTSIQGASHLEKLKTLYLAENKLRDVAGIGGFKGLTFLHLRANMISSLEGFSDGLPELTKLNLRKNEISSYNEIRRLQSLPKLVDLNILENPITANATYRLDVILLLPGLKRLDKIDVTNKEKKQSKDLSMEREFEQKILAEAEKFGEKKEEEWIQIREAQEKREAEATPDVDEDED